METVSIANKVPYKISVIEKELNGFADGESIDISTSIKKSGRIRPMYLAALSCLLLAVAMGLATGYSAPATYDMVSRDDSPVKPSESEVTWIGSMLALGAMMGGIFSGPLADKLGRKPSLIFNLVPFAGGWLTICYSKTVLTVMLGRFLCGLSCGVVSVIVPMYCVEISTADVRGKLGSAFQLFLMIGNLASVIIGSLVTWEYLALMGAIFTFIGVVCFIPVPETPRWFLAKGKLNEAILAMNKLQKGTVDAKEECNAIYNDLEGQPKGKLSLKECKHPTVYKPAFIAFSLMLFQQFSGINAVLFYSSDIFKVAKDFMNPKISTIVLGVFQVIATFISNFIVDKTGRKILLKLSGIFMALSLMVLGTYYYVSLENKDFQFKYSWIPLLSLICFVTAFSIGFGPVPWLLTAEMVPVRARSTVSGLATFSNGLFAFIVTKTFSEFKELMGNYGAFWFYSVLCILGTVFVFFKVPETKGKRLEDIEIMFHKKTQNPVKPSISVIA